MANLNLDQDVANKIEKMGIAGHIVANSYYRNSSLININPSASYQASTVDTVAIKAETTSLEKDFRKINSDTILFWQ